MLEGKPRASVYLNGCQRDLPFKHLSEAHPNVFYDLKKVKRKISRKHINHFYYRGSKTEHFHFSRNLQSWV